MHGVDSVEHLKTYGACLWLHSNHSQIPVNFHSKSSIKGWMHKWELILRTWIGLWENKNPSQIANTRKVKYLAKNHGWKRSNNGGEVETRNNSMLRKKEARKHAAGGWSSAIAAGVVAHKNLYSLPCHMSSIQACTASNLLKTLAMSPYALLSPKTSRAW
jgi:hypothetical protein